MALTGNYKSGYPVAATNAAWQKKKSFIDKAKKATKTGLGAKLTAAAQAYAAIKFNLLDPEKARKQVAADHGQTLMGNEERSEHLMQLAKSAAYEQQRDEVEAAIDALNSAEAFAKQTAKNEALSTTAKTAATSIANELRKHSAALVRIQRDDLDDFDKQIKLLQADFTRG